MNWCPDPERCKAGGECTGKIKPGYPIAPAAEPDGDGGCIVFERFGHFCQSCEPAE